MHICTCGRLYTRVEWCARVYTPGRCYTRVYGLYVPNLAHARTALAWSLPLNVTRGYTVHACLFWRALTGASCMCVLLLASGMLGVLA